VVLCESFSQRVKENCTRRLKKEKRKTERGGFNKAGPFHPLMQDPDGESGKIPFEIKFQGELQGPLSWWGKKRRGNVGGTPGRRPSPARKAEEGRGS